MKKRLKMIKRKQHIIQNYDYSFAVSVRHYLIKRKRFIYWLLLLYLWL